MPQFLFFPFYGPNRRSDLPVIELRLQFSDSEMGDFPEPSGELIRALKNAGVLENKDKFPAESSPGSRPVRYMELLTLTALRLQQRGGHKVTHWSLLKDRHDGRVTALVEHEDPATGMAAVKFASQLIADPKCVTRAAIEAFLKQARSRALSGETQAIIAALARRDIPWLHGDREPLEGKVMANRRIRANGLLLTGQGKHTEIIDGTFAVSRADRGMQDLLGDASLRRNVMAQCGLPVSDGKAEGPGTGQRHVLLVIGDSVMALSEHRDGEMHLYAAPHPGVAALAKTLSHRLGSFPLALHLHSPDLDRPLSESGGVARDFDLAPDLYALLAPLREGGQHLADACDRFVDWLHPGPGSSRITTVAITGTNGKTTTSQMVEHILRHTGQRPALVCTQGIFVNGRPVSEGDGSAFIGHARALSSKGIDSAVLETHHGGITVRGFAFDRCTVGVCLNVTAEHLADGEIETLEEMVEIKRALVERAEQAVVLNADNAGCRSMPPYLTAGRICWFSSKSSPEGEPADLELRVDPQKEKRRRGASSGHPDGTDPGYQPEILQCRIEWRNDEEWVVLHDRESEDLIKVKELPSTFGGAARFNLENAMAAISAAWLLGISPGAIRAAMREFGMSFQNTPGRLNHYTGLPFQAFIDFAHNPDGIRRLAEFAARLPVKGRRLLLLAAPGDRSDELVAGVARSAGLGFDHIVCRSYPNLRGRGRSEVPNLIAATLRAAGVAEENITIEPDAERAVDAILGMARPEDVVFLPLSRGEFSGLHERLKAMQQQNGAGP